jgi:hypothetical protein
MMCFTGYFTTFVFFFSDHTEWFMWKLIFQTYLKFGKPQLGFQHSYHAYWYNSKGDYAIITFLRNWLICQSQVVKLKECLFCVISIKIGSCCGLYTFREPEVVLDSLLLLRLLISIRYALHH